MINVKNIEEKLSKVQERYIKFMLESLKDWRLWAEASQRMADGKKVRDSILERFQSDIDSNFNLKPADIPGKRSRSN